MDDKIVANNLRRLRGELGLTQEDLAEKAGMSRAAYRNIETGMASPRVNTLEKLAEVLLVDLLDLLQPISRSPLKVRFRALKRMSKREQIIDKVARWLDEFEELEHIRRNIVKEAEGRDVLGEPIPFRCGEITNHLNKNDDRIEQAKEAAVLLRKYLNLSLNEPIHNICDLLNSNGIKVFPIEITGDDFFGLCVADDGRGPAVVINTWERISVERWIFSTAHELGHLLLHLKQQEGSVIEDKEDKAEEKDADTFASYFLMPRDAFLEQWKASEGSDIFERVFKIKRHFKVSYRTVLCRLTEEGLFSGKIWVIFPQLFKQRFGKTLGRKDEPDGLSPDHFSEDARSREPEHLLPVDFTRSRFHLLVWMALEHDKIPLSRAAGLLEIEEDKLQEKLALRRKFIEIESSF